MHMFKHYTQKNQIKMYLGIFAHINVGNTLENKNECATFMFSFLNLMNYRSMLSANKSSITING